MRSSWRQIICAALMGCALLPSTMVQAQRVFRHPGGILSQGDLNRIRTHVENGDEPWKQLWADMQNAKGGLAKSTYTASPYTELGSNPPKGNRQRAAQDAYAAMLNAIEWHVTGDKAYADCAAAILSAWGERIETAQSELFQYPTRSFVAAAEMLRDSTGSFYVGWDAASRNRFLDKVRNVMVPACQQFCTNERAHPSWFTPAAATVIGAGVLLDDDALYYVGVRLMTQGGHWRPLFGGTFEPNGQMREMGRDNVHAGLSLADITQACLTCWNQGDDLFAAGDNLLLKGTDYWCRYNTGHTDTPYTPLPTNEGGDFSWQYYFISNHDNSFRLRPDACCFEAVYHHYKEVKGIDVDVEYPYLANAALLARPDADNQMLGFGTLFFTINADASPFVTKRPARLQNAKAEAGINCVYLSWDHPKNNDVRGFKVYRSTSSSVDINGVPYYVWDYYTNNRFVDYDVEAGKTYYYRIRPLNYAGDATLASTTVNATPMAGEELADGWTFRSIGTSTGSAAYDPNVQDTSIVVDATGQGIDGRTDNHGFVYQRVEGDFCLTTRLASINEDFRHQGLMVRDNMQPNAARVALVKGEIGYRLLRNAFRKTTGSDSKWTNGTNYLKAPAWMRMKRCGNSVLSYVSKTGEEGTWILVDSVETSFVDPVFVGVGCASGNNDKTTRAVFDHVQLVAPMTDGLNAPITTLEENTSHYYNLQGQPLPDKPTAGIYIRRDAVTTVKQYAR